MKKKAKTSLLLAFLPLLCLSSFSVLHVRGSYVELKVTRAVWGENIDSPTKAHPGDAEVPLTVEAQNLSPDRTIKGVSATLLLKDGPFTDVYGNHNATATGQPTVGEILNPTDEVAPKGFFTLTFTLDIDRNAVPGTYRQYMIVKYSLKENGQFVEGDPQNLTVELVVSKTESTMTVSISPQIIEEGEATRVSGSIDPAPEDAMITLTYRKPDGTSLYSTAKTNIDGSFTESFQPDASGFWSINASWPGDTKYNGDWASISFEVRVPVSLSIATSNNRLAGGLDNQFIISLLNAGEVSVSALEVTLTVPSPLVVHGNNLWRFNYLGGGNSTSIPTVIYAPATSIGSTYSGSLTLNYRDDYGEDRTDSFPVGLIIVGRVKLVVYDKTVSPQLARNGSRVEVTTTLLNRGNVAAMYVNASILPNQALRLTSESSTYVGEVEQNSQAPFTLVAYVREDAENGTYPVTLSITYQDDQYIDHVLDTTVYLTVVALVETPTSSEGSGGILGILLEQGLVLLTIVLASVAILLLYQRHLSRQRRSNQS